MHGLDTVQQDLTGLPVLNDSDAETLCKRFLKILCY